MRKVIILIKKIFKKRNKSEIDITDFVNENNTVTEDKSLDVESPAPESQCTDNINNSAENLLTINNPYYDHCTYDEMALSILARELDLYGIDKHTKTYKLALDIVSVKNAKSYDDIIHGLAKIHTDLNPGIISNCFRIMINKADLNNSLNDRIKTLNKNRSSYKYIILELYNWLFSFNKED